MAGAFTVADLAESTTAEAVLENTDMIRADSGEISALTRIDLRDFVTAERAGSLLLARGPGSSSCGGR